MNYSFILDQKNKIDIDKLSQPINMDIIGKYPKNVIKENFSFANNQNIIKLPDGDEMSKMKVGNALKNNKELKDDENKVIKFAKNIKYYQKNCPFC